MVPEAQGKQHASFMACFVLSLCRFSCSSMDLCPETEQPLKGVAEWVSVLTVVEITNWEEIKLHWFPSGSGRGPRF